jgi:hypothetical protein
MEFLNNTNYKLLFDIIKEEVPNINVKLFHSVFIEFGNKEKGELLTLNKRFIHLFMSIVNSNQQQQHQQEPQQLKQQIQTQPYLTSKTFPLGIASPTEAIDVTYQKHSQLKRVSFENEMYKHRTHFQHFSSPPIPPTPNFSDNITEDKINIDFLLQKTLKDRNYDIPLIPLQKPPRQLEIGSIIPENEVKHDIIPLIIESIQSKSSEPVINNTREKITSSFFSKLHTIPNNSIEQSVMSDSGNNKEPTIYSLQNSINENISIFSQDSSVRNMFPLSLITSLQEDNMKLKKDMEEIKHTLSLFKKFLGSGDVSENYLNI